MADKPWELVPAGWTAAGLENAARAVFGLLVSEASWVHRRVDSITFTGRRGVCRQVSVDFAIPSDSYALLRGLPERPVPLSVMRRDPLIDFDLVDETGASVPLIASRAGDRLTFDVLRVACGVSGVDISHVDPKLLWDVAEGRPGSATKFFAAFGYQGYFEGTPLSWLVKALQSSFLLLASVQGSLTRRRVLKFRYEYVVPRRESSPGLLAQLGLRRSAVTFSIPGLGRSQGYHFELRAPEDLVVLDGRYERADWQGLVAYPPCRLSMTQGIAHLYLEDIGDEQSLTGRRRRARQLIEWCHAEHVFPRPTRRFTIEPGRVPRPLAAALSTLARVWVHEGTDSDSYRARIHLGPAASGTPAVALLSSTFAAVLLWILAAHGAAFLPPPGSPGTTQSASSIASVVLVVPAVAIGLIGRPASALSSGLLRLLQFAILVVAATLFLAAVEVIFPTKASDLQRVLADLASLATGIGSVAAIAWLQALRHGRPRLRRYDRQRR